jgi:hypothetical protein
MRTATEDEFDTQSESGLWHKSRATLTEEHRKPDSSSKGQNSLKAEKDDEPQVSKAKAESCMHGCYQVVERYSVCRCLYYKHAINACAAHGQRGHVVQEKTVLVGYACSSHTNQR